MRLTASRLTQFTPEILQDLIKLPLPVAAESTAKWLEQAEQVWIATFNAKVIGLLLLSHNGEQYTLEHMSVREVTRRRGVGRYLLTFVQANALQPQQPMVEHLSEQLADEALTVWQQFLQSCQWQANGAALSYSGE